MNRQLLSLALLCTAASAYAAGEQVYKWTDASGIVHYSDAPPPKDAQNVQTVRVTGGDRPHAVAPEAEAPAAEKPARKSTDANGGDEQAPPQNNVALENTPENRAQMCQQARNNLELLNSKFPVSVAGTNQAMDDKQRQAQIAAANAQVSLYCE